MSKIFLRFLKDAFDIREGEFLRVLLMQLNIFLIISTLLIIKPTVNGLFLSELGVEKLPHAFVLVAIFAVAISYLYNRFLGQVALNRILLSTLIGSVSLFLIFGVLLQLQVVFGWVLYAFYVCTAIFAVLTASQFWILANMVFNSREAKRLFGLIGAGAIAGGIFGGYLTTILAEVIGSENLIFVGAAQLVLCVPITIYIWNNYVVSTQSRFQRRKKIARSDYPLQIIRKSPHLSSLAGIIGVSVIVAKFVDYQFSAIASARIPDPDELTAFFGFWFSNQNVISLIIQLLLTRRIVGTLGVGTSLFFLPMSILLGAILIFFIPELWAAIFIKISDGSLKQSVNKAGVELLALPIPANIKNQTKTFIDVVVDSLATGIGGLILIFLISGLDLSTRFISLIILVLIGIWLSFVMRVRKTYLNAFKLSVQKANGDEAEKLNLDNESVLGDIRKILEKGSANQIIFLLKKIKTQPDDRLAKDFLKLLHHSSDTVKEEAIRNLYFIKSETFIEAITPFTKYPAQNVKIAAFDYLIAHAEDDRMALMETFLKDADHKIRLAALVSLAEESRDNPVLKEIFNLESRLEALIQELKSIEDLVQRDFYKIGLLKALGLAKMPRFFSRIEELFADENPKVARQAVLSAGETLHPQFLTHLISFLENNNLEAVAREALQKYGSEVVEVLSKYTQSDEARTGVVQKIPSVVEQFGTQAAADLLFELLQHENFRVRLTALRSLNQLKINFPYLNFYGKAIWKYILEEARLFQHTLSILYVQLHLPNERITAEKSEQIQAARQQLIKLLETRLDANLERIFRLLGLKYPPEEVISIYQSIQSKQPDLRLNAIEYLDNLLEPGLKKVLIPIVETALLDSISEVAIRELNVKLPNEAECYRQLLGGRDTEIKLAVEHLLELSGRKK